MVKVTHKIDQGPQSVDWHKRFCAQTAMISAAVIFGIFFALRHEAEVLLPMTRSAVAVMLLVVFVVSRRYLATRLGTTGPKAAMFGLGAATMSLLYFAIIYSVFETGDRISGGKVTTLTEAIDSMAEISTRVLTNTFDLVDVGAGMFLALLAGLFAELAHRLWGPPIRAPRV